MENIKGQFKALGGGSVSVVTIAAVVGWMNTSFTLGMDAEVILGVSVLLGVLIYGVIWLIPNITPSQAVDLEGVDLKGAIEQAGKDRGIDQNTLNLFADIATQILAESIKEDDAQ